MFPHVSGDSILDHRLVEQSVEAICRKGCRAVWSDIHALETGDELPETEGLTELEVHAVLRELKSVMAVYRNSCIPERAAL
jgi:hypothetical protein